MLLMKWNWNNQCLTKSSLFQYVGSMAEQTSTTLLLSLIKIITYLQKFIYDMKSHCNKYPLLEQMNQNLWNSNSVSRLVRENLSFHQLNKCLAWIGK